MSLHAVAVGSVTFSFPCLGLTSVGATAISLVLFFVPFLSPGPCKGMPNVVSSGFQRARLP